MDSITLLAKNQDGHTAEFTLFDKERQYSIGTQGDISLDTLYPTTRKGRTIYPVAGYITCIDGGWYFRSAKGHRRGIKAIKVNGSLIDASHAEVRLRHGSTITFGEQDEIVVTVFESSKPETLKDRAPELVGLFDEVKLEFESLNDLIRQTFDLDEKANTGVIMSKLEEHNLFNEAYEYNVARGLRNLVAHPSPGIAKGIKREYVYQGLQAIMNVRHSIERYADWSTKQP